MKSNNRFYIVFLVFTLLIGSYSFLGSAKAEVTDQAIYNYTGKDSAATLSQALSAAGAGNEVKVHINSVRDEDILASAPAVIRGEVDGLELDKAHGKWQATMLFTAGDKNLAPVKLVGRYDEMMQVPVLKRRLQSGDIISQDDIEWEAQPANHIRKNTIADSSQLIGKSPKRMVSEHRPIRTDEIAGPLLINKGARITLMYKSNALEIKTLGEAIDNGAKGDVIRVKNITSKSIIQGTVETGDRVRVTSPETNSAEAM
jgi:flagella basal body P-ring formation protein FlgA